MLVVHFIKSLNVPLDARGRAPFRRTAFELVRRVCECDMPPGEMRDALEHAVRRAFPDLWEPIPDEMSWAALMCVVRVQRHWRARAARARRRRQEAAGFGGKGGERPSASLGRRRPDGVSVPARLPGRRESAGERHRGGRPARGTRARSRTAAGLGAEASAAAAGTKPEPAPRRV